MRSTVSMMFAPGCRKTMMRIAGLPFARPVVLHVLDGIRDRGDVGEPEGRPVPVRDDERLVLGGLEELVGRRDGPEAVPAADVALRPVRVHAEEKRPHVLEAEAGAREGGRVHVHAHRRKRAPAHEHLPDARNLRELLLEDGRREVVHPRPLNGVRGQADQHDRGVGGIHLPIAGIVREVRGELAARRVDRRLDVPPGRVDVSRQVELDRDRRRAEGALRRHLRDPRDPPELPLERRRDRRGHRLGARAGQVRRNRDRRELHLGERRHREEEVRDAARERERDGQEARADRPADERSREAHRPPAGAGSARALRAARAPRLPRRRLSSARPRFFTSRAARRSKAR